MSSPLSSFSLIPFIVLYLFSAPSFHFCVFVCVLTIFSLHHLFTGKELGARSVPVQSRLCHCTKRVGVKHRHWHGLPGRWHHAEANGCRETWIYVCCSPLIQDLIPLVHLNLKQQLYFKEIYWSFLICCRNLSDLSVCHQSMKPWQQQFRQINCSSAFC